MLVISNGLDHDYEIVVSLIIDHMDEINLEKVQYLLLMHEQRLATKNSSDFSSFVNCDSAATPSMNVNVASYGSRFGSGYINNRGSYMNRGGRS